MLPFYRKQTTKNRTKLPNRSQPNSLRTTYHKLQSMVWFAARNGGGTGDGSIAQFPRSPLQHVRPRYIVSSVRVHISVRQSTPLRGDAGGEKKNEFVSYGPTNFGDGRQETPCARAHATGVATSFRPTNRPTRHFDGLNNISPLSPPPLSHSTQHA